MIWIIGDKGMLGTELSRMLEGRGASFFGSDRDCDITELAALRQRAMEGRPDWIVNCSAYTAVDKAEDEEELARRINALGAGNVASVARETGARLVHLSTDYVFAGDAASPYEEDAPIAPQGAYGRTKAEGEALVRAACPAHFILRTAWLYGKHGGNFVKTMLRLMAERPSIGVVADQRGSPTWARDLAAAIVHIVDRESTEFGTYHYANAGEITWHDFACAICDLGLKHRLLARDLEVKPITSAEYPSKVKRPTYSALSTKKIRERLGCEVPPWRASLERFVEELASGR